ncbi:MAG: hypothetical protein AB1Z98_17270 [Nannocystaceae bacterium]
MQALDEDAQLERLEELTARTTEAEFLDDLYTEPLPPGYVVVFTIDDQRRTLYSIRTPAGATHGARLCAVDMRVVLADAWDHYFTRWPDGVAPPMLERLIEEPPVPACHVRRTLWELVLHHTACAAAINAGNLILHDHCRSAAEREAAVAFVHEVQATSGALEARRMGRLAHLIGAWDDEDPMRASSMFFEDVNTAQPWVALFSRYMAAAHPNAERWWRDACHRCSTPLRSTEQAEQRMATTVARAWAATLLMTQSSALELIAQSSSPELAEPTLLETSHAMQRIESLGLMSQPAATAKDVTRWAKRVLRKGSPRLMKILDGQFLRFGVLPRPPARA